jgi:putative aldouronate transport system permease protein
VPHLISAYNIIIVRTYIEQIPSSLSEAAFIDGANDFQVFSRIIVPLCLPVLATISLFMAVWQWSQWQDTLFFASRKPELTTLQFEMTKIISKSTSKLTESQMRGNNNATVVTPESLKAAMVMIVTIPILVLYPFLQKYFVSGVTLGAVKE